MRVAPALLTLAFLVRLFSAASSGSFLIDPAGGTVLWNDATGADDAVLRGRGLGFSFDWLDDTPRTTLDVSTNGHLNVDGDAGYANELSPGLFARISPLWDDLEVVAGSGDSITERQIGSAIYAVTWRVHQQGSKTTRHAFQVALFGAATRLAGIDFAPGDIVFSYETLGPTFGKDSATVALDFGDGTVVAAAGATPETGILTHAAAIALPTSAGSFILFRRDEDGTYQPSTHVNGAPRPVADLRYTAGSSVSTIDVLANDTDPDGNPLAITAFSQGTVGNVTLSADGRQLIYSPGDNFAGTDSFTYTVADPFGLSDSSHVNIMPFTAGKGVFDGLLADVPAEGEDFALTADGVGYLKLALTATGGFTGSLVFGHATQPLRGTFSPAGDFTGTFSRIVDGETRAVTFTLHLDLTNTAAPLSGVVSDGTTTSQVTAVRGRYDARRFPAPQAGRYTATIQPDADLNGPAGIGYLLLSVTKSGAVRASGSLSDGRKITFGTDLKTAGNFPFFVSLPLARSAPGSLSGLMRFDSSVSDRDISAALSWFVPDTDEVPGFEAAPSVVGSRYVPPLRGKCVLPLPATVGNAEIDLGAGQMVEPATITPANKISLSPDASTQLRLNIAPKTGLFSGTVGEPSPANPDRMLRRKVSGVFVTKQKVGGGYFLSSDGSSVPVTIGAPAAAR